MIDKLHLSEITSPTERQQRYIFFYTCAGYMAGIVWSFFSDAAPRTMFYHSINALHLGLLLGLMILFLAEKATAKTLIALFLVITQIEISVEMIHEAVEKAPAANLVIIGNMVLLALLLMISIASYFRIIPYLLGGASIATYALCTFLTTEIFPFNFLPAYTIAFVGLGAMGARMNRIIRDISAENNTYRTERQSILDLFRMDTEQLTQFIHLARLKELSMEQTETLLGLLNEQTHKKITEAITEEVQEKALELAAIEQKIPGLTPAEKEVCMCILKGRNLAQTVKELGKSPSNITNVRSRIRKKLRLEHNEDLQSSLTQIIYGKSSRKTAAPLIPDD